MTRRVVEKLCPKKNVRLFLTPKAGIALAYFCCAVSRNMDEANTLLPIYNVTGMFFTGLLFTFDQLPVGWKWYTWTNFVRYAWSAHMTNEFEEECEAVADFQAGRSLSGPVSRDTARLSQRYPLLRAMVFLVSQHGQVGAIPPPPFLSVSPLESMRSLGAIPPPTKGVSQRCLCDTI